MFGRGVVIKTFFRTKSLLAKSDFWCPKCTWSVLKKRYSLTPSLKEATKKIGKVEEKAGDPPQPHKYIMVKKKSGFQGQKQWTPKFHIKFEEVIKEIFLKKYQFF